MKKVMMIIVMVAAFVLPTMAQFGQQDPNKVQFQSTSTMQTSGSTLTSQPMLNADGTAYNPTAGSSGPRKAKMEDDDDDFTITTPGTTGSQAPIGEAILPLSLMALAFAGVIYLRRRRAALKR